MINILIDELPSRAYENKEIKTDFRAWIVFEIIYTNPINAFVDIEKYLVDLMYKEKPSNYEVAFLELVRFWSCYNEVSESYGESEPLYDFEVDAERIYSAFMKIYGIDLTDIGYMHWFKFRALLRDVCDGTEFGNAVYYRSINLNNIKDNDERNRVAKIKNSYAL